MNLFRSAYLYCATNYIHICSQKCYEIVAYCLGIITYRRSRTISENLSKNNKQIAKYVNKAVVIGLKIKLLQQSSYDLIQMANLYPYIKMQLT